MIVRLVGRLFSVLARFQRGPEREELTRLAAELVRVDGPQAPIDR